MIKAKDLLPGDVYKLQTAHAQQLGLIIEYAYWLVVSITPTDHDQVRLLEINCAGTLNPYVVSGNRSLELVSRPE